MKPSKRSKSLSLKDSSEESRSAMTAAETEPLKNVETVCFNTFSATSDFDVMA